MILGLAEPVFMRRAWLAMLLLPCSALLAGAVAFLMVGTTLSESLHDEVGLSSERIQWACFLTVAVPVVVYLVGGWLAEHWRKRYAPRCPSCQFEFAILAAQVVKTRRCGYCGLNVDELAAEQPTSLGLTRAELGRRLKQLNEQFAKALGYAFLPLCIPGIWLMGSAVMPAGPWSLTDSRLLWTVCIAMFGYVLALWFTGRKRKQLTRTLGLECPGCATPLPNVMPQVTATGCCPKCRRIILTTPN